MNFIKHIQQENLRENDIVTNHLITNTGIRLSVQASEFHYCTPRKNLEDINEYETFEIALINEDDNFVEDFSTILKYFEREDELMRYKDGTILTYVPKDLVEDLYIYLNL